jgi:uncharacterized membrane protein YvlD (DUF360 family)
MDRDLVARHLLAGERLVWRQIAPPTAMLGQKLYGLLFSLLWAGFAWVWTSVVLLAMVPAVFKGGLSVFIGVPVIFVAFGLFLSCIGAGLVWSAARALAMSWRTEYALTDRRLIIVEGAEAQSYSAQAFVTMRRDGGDARGAIRFDWGPLGRAGVGFNAALEGVRDPARVEALIRTTLKPPRDSSASY